MNSTTTAEFVSAQSAKIGQELGVSDWILLDQDAVDQFAALTGDPQWIHTDPERAARQTPFGGTIVHGFFVLSLAVQMADQCLEPPKRQKMGLNYGFDKVRFINPVPVGSRVRGRFVLEHVEEKNPGQVLSRMGLSIEIEGQEKPAVIAQWLGMALV